jgi:hypothetical protein
MRNFKVIGTVFGCIAAFYFIAAAFKAVAGIVITLLVCVSVVAAVYTVFTENDENAPNGVLMAIGLPAKIAFGAIIGLGMMVQKKLKALEAPKP